MRYLIKEAMLGALVMCAASSVQAANFLGNESFEDPPTTNGQQHPFGNVPHWEGREGSCLGANLPIELWNNNGSIRTPFGSQHLEISAGTSNQSVCQTVTNLTESCPTRLCFWYTGRPGIDGTTGNPYDNTFTVELFVAHTFSVTLTAPVFAAPVGSPPGTGWVQYCTPPFNPTSSVLRTSFSRSPADTNDIGGAHIDNVTLLQSCGAAEIPDDHLYCYRVKDRFKPNSLVTIVDQFGVHHGAKVLKPYLLCTAAKKCVETRCVCADGVDRGPYIPDFADRCTDLCAAVGSPPGAGISVTCEGRCGDGTVDAGCCEECDDDNQDGGDGCSPNCQIE